MKLKKIFLKKREKKMVGDIMNTRPWIREAMKKMMVNLEAKKFCNRMLNLLADSKLLEWGVLVQAQRTV